MNNLIITDEYLERVITDLKGEQKLILQTIGRIDDDTQEKNNKFVSLLSDGISMMLKIKAFRKPKDDKKQKITF